MQTLILDASKIDPQKDACSFLSEFYSIPAKNLADLRRELYADPAIRVTEVFNWPIETENWKEISATLELIQQHSTTLYVIWGPETTDAITFDQNLLHSKPKAAQQ